jgi:hypothetical protein
MQTIKVRAHIGSDGLLKLEVPVDVANVDVDVVIVYSVESKVADADWDAFVDGILGDEDATEPTKPSFDFRKLGK